MWSFAKRYPLVFFTGVTALALGVGLGVITGAGPLWSHPLAQMLRYVGLGYMAAGFGLWIAHCRELAEKPALSPFFNMTITPGLALLALALIVSGTPAAIPLMWAGMGLIGGALIVGMVSMVVDPAYPAPLGVTWPQGGEECRKPYTPGVLLHREEGLAENPDDLTKLRGISESIQDTLYEAGIVSYVHLSQQTPEYLLDVLREYCVYGDCDPRCWIEQAKLAAAGEWETLRELQARLEERRQAA